MGTTGHWLEVFPKPSTSPTGSVWDPASCCRNQAITLKTTKETCHGIGASTYFIPYSLAQGTHQLKPRASQRWEIPGAWPLLMLSLAVEGNISERAQQSLHSSGPGNLLSSHVTHLAPQRPNPHLPTGLVETAFTCQQGAGASPSTQTFSCPRVPPSVLLDRL